jgi:hypothetical protein
LNNAGIGTGHINESEGPVIHNISVFNPLYHLLGQKSGLGRLVAHAVAFDRTDLHHGQAEQADGGDNHGDQHLQKGKASQVNGTDFAAVCFDHLYAAIIALILQKNVCSFVWHVFHAVIRSFEAVPVTAAHAGLNRNFPDPRNRYAAVFFYPVVHVNATGQTIEGASAVESKLAGDSPKFSPEHVDMRVNTD